MKKKTVKQSKKAKLRAARIKRQVMQIVRDAYSSKNDALPPMSYIRSKLDVLIHEDRLWP